MTIHPDFPFAAPKPSRHGKLRFRFTKGDRPLLPGVPGDEAFLAAYTALCVKHGLAAPQATQEERRPARVIELHGRDLDACWRLLRQEKRWKGWSLSTRKAYAICVERMLEAKTEEQGLRYGSCGPVAELRRKHVKHILRVYEDKPFMQATALQALRHLFKVAMDTEDADGNAWMEYDPSAGMEIELPQDSDGHPMWEPEHLDKFEHHFAPGSMQRTAYALALWLGNRCSDVARLDWSMLTTKPITIDGARRMVEGFEFVQFKGRRFKRGEKVFLPLTDMLARDLQGCVRVGPVLTNTWGNRFTDGSLSNAFRKWAREAGIEAGYSIHGLRKSLLTKLADADANDRMITAVAGWSGVSSKLATIYTGKADKARQSVRAMDMLEEADRQRPRPKLKVVR